MMCDSEGTYVIYGPLHYRGCFCKWCASIERKKEIIIIIYGLIGLTLGNRVLRRMNNSNWARLVGNLHLSAPSKDSYF